MTAHDKTSVSDGKYSVNPVDLTPARFGLANPNRHPAGFGNPAGANTGFTEYLLPAEEKTLRNNALRNNTVSGETISFRNKE